MQFEQVPTQINRPHKWIQGEELKSIPVIQLGVRCFLRCVHSIRPTS